MNTYTEPQYAFNRARLTWGVQRLIFINIIVFAVQLLVDIPFGDPVLVYGGFAPPGGFISRLLAFQPGLLFYGMLWKPFTYQFLHGGLMHLFMNMLWLFFFGPDVERMLGTRQFLRFYVVSGAVAVLATLLPWVAFGHQVSVTGASGAVMAVLVAFVMINPDRQFFLFPLPFPINARALMLIVIVMNIFAALSRGGTTSVATHFGGMAVGFLYMRYMPRARRWMIEQRRKKYAGEDDVDSLREMVDNIFKFDDWKKRR